MANSFRFRLQSIVRLRQRDRDDAAESLRQALKAKLILENQVLEIQTERDEQNEFRIASHNGSVDPQKLINAQRYQMYLDHQVTELQNQISLVDQECERRRAALVKCEQAVRSLEKLHDNQRSEWSAQQASLEQAGLDQWSSFRHWTRQLDTETQGLDS